MVLKYCETGDYICYLLSNEILGALAWIGFVITIVGLAIALYQIAQLRSAADTANLAIDKLSTHLDGVNLAYISAQMNTVALLIQHNEFVTAELVFSPIKRSVRLHASARDLDALEWEALQRTLGKIDQQFLLGKTGNPKFNAITTSKLIDGLLSQLVGWESTVSVKHRKEISLENT